MTQICRILQLLRPSMPCRGHIQTCVRAASVRLLPVHTARRMLVEANEAVAPMIRRNASQLLRPVATMVAVLGLLLAAPAALAQPADGDTSGWDDGSEAEPEPEAEPAAAPAPAPAPASGTGYADTDPSALTEFEPELQPYGTWIEDPRYGVVWVPYARVVGPDFAPYVTSGHWAIAPDGDWMWVSDYPFGWVVFHYGRWVWVPGTGWAWIPGRQYAHAWVVWRVPADDSYAYVGWAPAPPTYVWYHGSAVVLYYVPPAPYVFCPSAYVFSYHVHRHIVVNRHRVYGIARHTRRYAPQRGVARRAPGSRAARVPRDRVPATRTPANPRAVAAASRRTRSSSNPAPKAGRPTPGQAKAGTRPSAVPTRRPAAPRTARAGSSPFNPVRAKPATASQVPRGIRPASAPRRASRPTARPAAPRAKPQPYRKPPPRTQQPARYRPPAGASRTPRSPSRMPSAKPRPMPRGGGSHGGARRHR